LRFQQRRFTLLIVPAMGTVNNPFFAGVKHSKTSAFSCHGKILISVNLNFSVTANEIKWENYSFTAGYRALFVSIYHSSNKFIMIYVADNQKTNARIAGHLIVCF
jgi:hypothetical protein